jgi:hypothetical protein
VLQLTGNPRSRLDGTLVADRQAQLTKVDVL